LGIMWKDRLSEEEEAAVNKLTIYTREIINWSIDEDIENADWLKRSTPPETVEPLKGRAINPYS
jgi:hypothetical protein